VFLHVLSGFMLLSYCGRKSESLLHSSQYLPQHPFTLLILSLFFSQLSFYLESALPTRLKYTVKNHELKGKQEQAKLKSVVY